jgi:ketosteroid isomerase-like protein
VLKRAGIGGLLLLAVILVSGTRATTSPGYDRTRSERELLALETAWDDAVAAKDTTALQRIIADDFVMIGADGTVSDKHQLIEGIADPQLQIEPFQTEDVRVRVYGSVAVLTGRYSQRGRWKGQAYETAARYTDVYVKTGGRWHAVSAQATRIPAPAKD